MNEAENLSHTKWECKYHVVFEVSQADVVCAVEATLGGGLPQVSAAEGESHRGRALDVGSCAHDDCDPAKVCGVAGNRLHQRQERDSFGAGLWREKRNFVGQPFWARGYFVSTVGRDEAVIREYIRDQEHQDHRLDQMNLWR